MFCRKQKNIMTYGTQSTFLSLQTSRFMKIPPSTLCPRNIRCKKNMHKLTMYFQVITIVFPKSKLENTQKIDELYFFLLIRFSYFHQTVNLLTIFELLQTKPDVIFKGIFTRIANTTKSFSVYNLMLFEQMRLTFKV